MERRLSTFLALAGALGVLGRPAQAVTQFVSAGDTGTPIKFLLVDSATGQSGQTGKTGSAVGTHVACASGVAGSITVTYSLSGNGATNAEANAGGNVAESGTGKYDYYPAVGEVANATGKPLLLTIHVVCAGCLTQDYTEEILPGGILTAGAGANQINPTGGNVPASGVLNGGGALEAAPSGWHSVVISNNAANSNLVYWNGTAPNGLQAGRVDVYAGAYSGATPGWYLAPPALSTIVTGLLTDTTAGDFTTPNSIGYAIANYLTGNAFTRLGAPAGASIAADIANVPTATLAVKVDAGMTWKQASELTASILAGAFSPPVRSSAAPWTLTVSYYLVGANISSGAGTAATTTTIATLVTTYTDATFTRASGRTVTFVNLP